MSKKEFRKYLKGASLGTGLALIFAKKKGSETRQELKLKLDELWTKAKNVDTDEVKEAFQKKVDEIKKELSDLDKEKAIDLAKKKSEDLKKQCEELLKLAKEKGTPVLEGVAKDVKEKAIIVTKEVLKKLEDPKK